MQTFTDLRGQARPPTDLPLFDAPATVRTFDSPEFRDVTFYEVEAKSILNRVPARFISTDPAPGASGASARPSARS